MVNFCVFSLLLSHASREPSGNISLWWPPPLPTGKLGKLTPPSPWKIRSLPWGGGDMDIFSNHTLHVLTPFFFNIFLSDLSAVIWTVFKLYEVILFLLQLNWIVWPINSISLHGYLNKKLPNILFDLFLSLTCCLSYNFL